MDWHLFRIISVYDPLADAFTHVQHDPNHPDSLVENDIRAIVANDDWMIIATRSGVNLADTGTKQIRRLGRVQGCEDLLAMGKLTSLAVTEHLLLIGSANGLCQIDIAARPLSDDQLIGKEIAALADKRLFNIEVLSRDEAWISTSSEGIAVFNLLTSDIRWIAVDENDPNNLNHAWVDDTTLVEDEVWAATAGGGIAVIDPDTLVVKEHIVHRPANPTGLALSDISAVFVDDSGLVWIGTWGAGINRFNPANSAFKVLKADPFRKTSLADSDIRSAKEMHNGDVWMGGLATGIQVLRPGVGLVATYPPEPGKSGALQNGYVVDIEQLPNGEIWVATNQTGVYRYNPETDDFSQFTTEQGLTDDSIRTLYLQDDTTLWVGTDAGLTQLDLETGVFTAIDVRGASNTAFDKVVETIVYFDGYLWVGTNDGLFVLPDGSRELMPVASDAVRPLSDNFVADLSVDSRGRLWLATAQGLDILSSWDGTTAAFMSVNEKLGLPRQSLGEAIEEDSRGRIWAQSNLIDPDAWSYTRITRHAGWDVGNQWIGSNARLRDGTLLFGGTRGVLMVRPQDYERWQYAPAIAITRSQVDSRSVVRAQMSPLALSPSTRSFFIEFAALDFSGSASYEYRYKLEGYDDDWVTTDARSRRATYSRLAPGDYVLRVKAVGSTGNDSRNELAIAVQQLPAWYQTYWFMGLVVFFSLLVLYLLYKWRIAALNSQKQALDRLVEQRTENIRQLGQAGQDITASLDLDRVLICTARRERPDCSARCRRLWTWRGAPGSKLARYSSGSRCLRQ